MVIGAGATKPGLGNVATSVVLPFFTVPPLHQRNLIGGNMDFSRDLALELEWRPMMVDVEISDFFGNSQEWNSRIERHENPAIEECSWVLPGIGREVERRSQRRIYMVLR